MQQSGRQRGQRVQGYWWTASDERKAELRALWPELVQAITDLDELLQLPVIKAEHRYAFGEIPGAAGRLDMTRGAPRSASWSGDAAPDGACRPATL